MPPKRKPNVKFTLKIPYEIVVGIYITLMILLSLFIYLYKNKLENSYFRNNYFIYYLAFMFNLLNLAIFTVFYNKKKNKIKALPGPQGDKGMKGERGKYITCSFCEHNLYFFKTKKYREILKMEVGLNDKDETQLNTEIFGFAISNLDLDLDYFDLSFLRNIYEISKKNKIIQTLKNLFNFTTRMKYLSYNLNKTIKKGDIAENISFLLPVGGNGYFPIGHSVISSDIANKLNSFLVNGDIAFPKTSRIKFTFRNMTLLERQGEELESKKEMDFSIIEAIPPKNFVSLGEIIVRNDIENDSDKSGGLKSDLNMLACIRKSCAKEISNDLLQLMAIKISYKTDNEKINRILNYTTKTNFDRLSEIDYSSLNSITHKELDIYSIWKTPLNTFVTNCVIANKTLVNGSVGYNILDGNKKYTNSNGFSINKSGVKKIKSILNKIKLPRIVRTLYITLGQYNRFFEEISYYLSNIIPDLEKEKKKLTNAVLNSSKTYSQKEKDRNKVIHISKKIDVFNHLINSIAMKSIYTNFEDLFDKETHIMLDENIPDMNDKRQLLKQIPFIIESKETLYDMLIYFYPEGLSTRIAVNKDGVLNGGLSPSKLQYEILKISRVCFPPNTKIYLPKDECLSFNSFDLDRRKIIQDLDFEINNFNEMFLNSKNEDEKGNCDKFKNILKMKSDMDTLFVAEFGHIKNYSTKIETKDFDVFSNSRLELILDNYKKMNKYMTGKCGN